MQTDALVSHNWLHEDSLVSDVRSTWSTYSYLYSGADKSIARPTSRCFFWGGVVRIFRLMLFLLYIQGVPGGMCQNLGECSLC